MNKQQKYTVYAGITKIMKLTDLPAHKNSKNYERKMLSAMVTVRCMRHIILAADTLAETEDEKNKWQRTVLQVVLSVLRIVLSVLRIVLPVLRIVLPVLRIVFSSFITHVNRRVKPPSDLYSSDHTCNIFTTKTLMTQS